jgi:hypothetical protein
MRKLIAVGHFVVPLMLLALAVPAAWAASAPGAHNLDLLGSNDLQGRKAYQPSIIRQGEHWVPISVITVAASSMRSPVRWSPTARPLLM